MAKYIDRDALVDWLKRIPLKDLSDGLGLCRVIMEDDFKRAIKEMPEGIIILDNGHSWNYCPNCGAKMDGNGKT